MVPEYDVSLRFFEEGMVKVGGDKAGDTIRRTNVNIGMDARLP